MTNLSIFEFNSQRIREQDGKYSVYDIIQVIGGKKNPRDTWKDLCNEHSELVGKTDRVKFPRKDGKRSGNSSPGCSDVIALEIIGLLPGKVGAKYRKEAAELFASYVKTPHELAMKAVDRVEDEESLKQVKDRVESKQKYLQSYHGVHGQLKAHGAGGVHHATVNKHNNGLVGVQAGDRQKMERSQEVELTVIQGMEEIALMSRSTNNTWHAVNRCKKVGNETAQKIKQIKET